VTSPVRDKLTGAIKLIEEAGFAPVMEIPGALSRVVGLLESARAGLLELAPPERALAVAQLKSFREKLVIVSGALKRSEAIFQGYSRYAGVSMHEYGPVGSYAGARDPAFFSVTV
jgi:hypothetical protein